MLCHGLSPPRVNVRPLAGAGIEIELLGTVADPGTVRPLAGAGIEIVYRPGANDTIAFAPSRGRELK